DGAMIGGGTYIGGGTGLHKLVDLTELGIEYPMTGLFTTRKFAGANRDTVLAFIRGYLRGVKFFQERKDDATAITARNLRSTNSELIQRQWQYAKSYMFEKIPYPTEKGFKAVFDLLAPRTPKVASLRFEDVADTGYVRELADKGFFKERAVAQLHALKQKVMAEILGLGTTHAPTLWKIPEEMTSSLRRTLAGKHLPPHLRDPRNWPDAMRAEWADDYGAAAGREYNRRCFAATRELRARLDAFKPDLVL